MNGLTPGTSRIHKTRSCGPEERTRLCPLDRNGSWPGLPCTFQQRLLCWLTAPREQKLRCLAPAPSSPAVATQPQETAPMQGWPSQHSSRDELVHLSLNPLSFSLNRAYAQTVNKRICQGNCFLCHQFFYSLSFQRPEKTGTEQTGKNN